MTVQTVYKPPKASGGTFFPPAADTYDLGSTSKEWRSLYLGDAGCLYFGLDQDESIRNRATSLNANTALAGSLIGTPVTPVAVAANSLLIANVTASGDILLAVNQGGTSYMAFMADASAGNTNLGAPTGGEIRFYFNGTLECEINSAAFNLRATRLDSAGNITANTATGPAVLDEAATSTNPTLVPNRADDDTGIGWSTDQIDLIVNGSRVLDIKATDIYNYAGASISNNGSITANNAAGPAILNEAATATNPTLIPNRAEYDTGIGWQSDDIYLVLGGSAEYHFGTTYFVIGSGDGGVVAATANYIRAANVATGGAGNVVGTDIRYYTGAGTGTGTPGTHDFYTHKQAAAGDNAQSATRVLKLNQHAVEIYGNIVFAANSSSSPSGSSAAIYRDADGEVTVNVLTGKTFNVAVNGTDEYNFSSTTLDLNIHTLTKVGNAGSSLTGTAWTLAADNGISHSTLSIQNLETTASTQSDAILQALVSATAGNNTGDPKVLLSITGGTSYYVGVDNSLEGDPWSIGIGAEVGTTGLFLIRGSGAETGSSSRIVFSPTDVTYSTATASAAGKVYNLLGGTSTLSNAATPRTGLWSTFGVGQRTFSTSTTATTLNKVTSAEFLAPKSGHANIILGNTSAIRILDSGAGTGAHTVQTGLYIEDLTSGTSDYGIYIEGADTAAIYVASADPIHLGVAGASTGKIEIDGATSGTVTLTVGAAAGTWTMTLPAAVGGAGQQLTDVAGNGVTSWAAAASSRDAKDIIGVLDPQDALDTLLGTKVYRYHYQPNKGTLDTSTEYAGPVAEEAPWAMHYSNSIVNPVNTLGYMVAGIQALNSRISRLEQLAQI